MLPHLMDAQLKRFTKCLNRIISGKVPSLVVNQGSIWIRIVVKLAINALKRSRSCSIQQFHFLRCFLLLLVHKSLETEVFRWEWKKGMIIKISKKGNNYECSNLRVSPVLSAMAKRIAKIIVKGFKKYIETLIGREQSSSLPGTSYPDQINTSL